LLDRDSWEAASPLASLGLATNRDRRRGAAPGLVLAGVLFGAIGLLVVGYGMLERDARANSQVYLSEHGYAPALYLVPTPVR
jgi:hypothetical protein